jgi:hypothetical protein
MHKFLKVVLIIVGAIATVVLIASAASWADANHAQPMCGSQSLQPGEVCDENGSETTYDQAVQEQQNARSEGPTFTVVSGAVLVGSIACGVALGRRKAGRRPA